MNPGVMHLKGSYKLRALGNVSEIIAAAPSNAAAASQLGVTRSTVYRWVRSGKVQAPARRQRRPAAAPGRHQSPEAWGRSVRRAYELTSTEVTLLDLAVRALTLARDEKVRAEVQLVAMGRFWQLVKALNLETPAVGQIETDKVRQFPRGA
jgi:hypothetical protein